MYRSFLRTDELPTRTTSRTYLKLLNVWIWKTYESLLDRVSNEKDAKGFEAEMRLDLGHQFYLYTDDKNRKILKALVNKWKEELPPLFNIPI